MKAAALPFRNRLVDLWFRKKIAFLQFIFFDFIWYFYNNLFWHFESILFTFFFSLTQMKYFTYRILNQLFQSYAGLNDENKSKCKIFQQQQQKYYLILWKSLKNHFSTINKPNSEIKFKYLHKRKPNISFFQWYGNFYKK